MMDLSHINRAVSETCPFGKTECCHAVLGSCEAVNIWRGHHRALEHSFLIPFEEARRDIVEQVKTDHKNNPRVPKWVYFKW